MQAFAENMLAVPDCMITRRDQELVCLADYIWIFIVIGQR